MEMKELLKQGIAEALDKAIAAGTLPAGDYPAISLEVPPQKEFGDFATNIAMQSRAEDDCRSYCGADGISLAGSG